MTSTTDRMQELVDTAYARWQANGHWSKQDFWDQLGVDERFAVYLSNMNYQVQNGGWSQWIGNGYGTPEVARDIELVLIRIGTPAATEAGQVLKAVYEAGLEEPSDPDEFDEWYATLSKLDDRYYKIDEQLMADCESFIEKTWPAETSESVILAFLYALDDNSVGVGRTVAGRARSATGSGLPSCWVAGSTRWSRPSART